MIKKDSVQGSNHYENAETEKFRYTPYRKYNRILAEAMYLGEVEPRPLHVIIETSSICNLKCGFCNREVMTRPQMHMELDLFKKVVDQAAELMVHSLSLYALGEPLMNKQIVQMVKYAKLMGIPYCDLSTNGMFDMTRLLGTGLNELIISLDGFKESHESLRKGADYNKIIRNIDEFFSEKFFRHDIFPMVRMQIIDIPETHHQIAAYIDKWGKRADVVYVKKLEAMAQSLGEKLVKFDESKMKDKCKQLSFILTVNSNGDICRCCHDPCGKSVVGNIESMTLKEAWHKEIDMTDFCKNCMDRLNW